MPIRKLVAVAAALAAFVACEKQPPNTHAPSMANHQFTPKSITIGVGEAVRWVNDTDEAHTVTAEEKSLPQGAEFFSSGDAPNEEAALDSLSDELIEPGEVYEWTFEQSGTYVYFCIPHRADGMEGTIVVEE